MLVTLWTVKEMCYCFKSDSGKDDTQAEILGRSPNIASCRHSFVRFWGWSRPNRYRPHCVWHVKLKQDFKPILESVRLGGRLVFRFLDFRGKACPGSPKPLEGFEIPEKSEAHLPGRPWNRQVIQDGISAFSLQASLIYKFPWVVYTTILSTDLGDIWVLHQLIPLWTLKRLLFFWKEERQKFIH